MLHTSTIDNFAVGYILIHIILQLLFSIFNNWAYPSSGHMTCDDHSYVMTIRDSDMSHLVCHMSRSDLVVIMFVTK